MRPPLLTVCLCILWTLAAQGQAVFDSPVASPNGALTARCSRSVDPATRSVCSTLILTDRDGTVVHRDEDALWDRAVESLRWTPDGQFLVLTTRSGGGHHAWRYYVYAYSVAAKSVRSLDAALKQPVICADIWCQAPDVVVFVAQDASRIEAAPNDDHPVVVRLALAQAWPQLQ